MLAGQMQIDGGLFEITMTEQDLNRAQVSACLQQMGRETVSKSMRVNMAICKSGAFGGALAGRPQTLVVTGRFHVCQAFPGNSQTLGLRLRVRQ